MKKRFLTIFLAVIMTATLLPTTASAANSDFVIEDGVLTEYNGPGGDVVIPEGVTGIGFRAFYECTSLTSVTIPDSVISIGGSAFRGCANLTSLYIPGSVTSVGMDAFSGCTGLTSAGPIGSGCSYQFGWTTAIPELAFRRLYGLTSVTIPEGVTSIEYSTFSDCTSLTSVTIPKGVTSIGGCAFAGCTGLKSVTIPNSVTTIGGSAFVDCTDLTSVTIPDSVTCINWAAFYRCTSLTSATILGGKTEIVDGAFSYCDSLTIYGYWGSTAETYCKAENIPFVILDVAPGTAVSGTMTSDSGASVTWDITAEGEVTVEPTQMAKDETVLVGCYDSQGRFTDVKVLDADHASAPIDPNTPNVKLFWLNEVSQPQSPSVTVWGK